MPSFKVFDSGVSMLRRLMRSFRPTQMTGWVALVLVGSMMLTLPERAILGQQSAGTAKAKTTVKKKSETAKSIETEALRCRTAGEALLAYQIFLADDEISDDEKKGAQPRFEYWQKAASDELVRVGTKWIPKTEADRLKLEADKLVAEAFELLNVKNFNAADSKLEKASRIYPEHLDSLFLLGVGAFLNSDYKGAEKRFTQCLSRAPNHVAVLNNTAVCEVLTKKFDKAARNWELAASIDPDNEDLAQNLGRFIADANDSAASKGTKSKDFGRVDKKTLDRATDVYSKLLANNNAKRADLKKGYVILLSLQAPKGKGKGKGFESVEESQVVGNGTGFVIWNEYILTNRHVVADADSLVIQSSTPNSTPMGAKVFAISKELDLALIHCPGLKTAPVKIQSDQIQRGAEVLALGFPVMDVVGKGLKATRGIVTGLPSKETDNMMVLDVQINPGNSGGPLCNRSGQVVGVVAAKTYTERFVQGYGLAIPMSDAAKFVRKHLPAFQEQPAANAKNLEWTDVDAAVSPATVVVLIKKRKK